MPNSLVSFALWACSIALAGAYVPHKKTAAAYENAKAAGAESRTNPLVSDAKAVAEGARLYEARCEVCHGGEGKGDGVAAVAMTPPPADLTSAERWAYSSVGVKQWIVVNGVAKTSMAPTGLTEDESWQVLAFIQQSFQP